MNIVFLLRRDPDWNCLGPLYSQCLAKRLNTTVVVIANRADISKTENIFDSPNTNSACNTLKSCGVVYRDLNTIEFSKRVEYLESLRPSCIITTTKDDDMMLGFFGMGIKELSSKFRFMYVPYYSATIIGNDDIHTRADGHKYYWRFTVDSKILQKYYLENGIESHKIINFGHPKIESTYKLSLQKKTNNINSRLSILWAPHWSCPEYLIYKNSKANIEWVNSLRFGTFLNNCWDFYRYAKNNVDSTQWFFRPHPSLQSWLYLHGGHHEFRRWFSLWNALPNTTPRLDGIYNDVFVASDLCITDGISFLSEYPIATNKPLIFIENKIHENFNELGEIAKPIWNIAHNFETVENMIKNHDSLKRGNTTALLDELLPHKDNTSSMIVDTLINHLQDDGAD